MKYWDRLNRAFAVQIRFGPSTESHWRRWGRGEVNFYYICIMKAMVIAPRTQTEFKFLHDLLEKLGITSATMTEEELEDLGLAKLMKAADKSRKVSRESIMKKLKA